MKIIPVLTTSFLLAFSATALANECDHADKRDFSKTEYFQSLSDEEKVEFKAVKDKLEKMSKEEKKAYKNDVKSKWDALSQADKDAFIAQHQGKIDKAVERQKERFIVRLYGFNLLKSQQ